MWGGGRAGGSFALQVSAMRRGLIEVVPERALKLCTWEELEVLVCGDPHIDVAVMKANTTYHGFSVRASAWGCWVAVRPL
jgi:hypothetical protein